MGWHDRNPMSYRFDMITDRGIAIRPTVTDADLKGDEAMQRVNVRLGYVPRSVSRTMRRDLP